MNKWIWALIFVSPLLFLSCTQNSRLERLAVPSPSLEDAMIGAKQTNNVLVYLPPSYFISEEEGKRFPVVYFLPGYSTPPELFVEGVFQGFKLDTSLDSLILAGRMDEMIVVIPDGRSALQGAFYVNSPVVGNWEDFITEDLLTFIDREYRTFPDRNARFIAGHSMGGFGAINLAMRHSDLYSAAYAISPGLFDRSGLSSSQMFANREEVHQFLSIEAEIQALPDREAQSHYLQMMRDLSANRDTDQLFSHSYGSAFAPDVSGKPPYIRYPFRRTETGIEMDTIVWRLWESGFGGIRAEFAEYGDNLRSLKGIYIDYGELDEYPWLPEGCRYFIDLAQQEQLPVLTRIHDDGHYQKLRESLENFMFPWFTQLLHIEQPVENP